MGRPEVHEKTDNDDVEGDNLLALGTPHVFPSLPLDEGGCHHGIIVMRQQTNGEEHLRKRGGLDQDPIRSLSFLRSR